MARFNTTELGGTPEPDTTIIDGTTGEVTGNDSNGDGGNLGIDPVFAIDGDNGDGRKRRKRRGTDTGGDAGTAPRKRASAKALSLSVDSLTEVLKGIHVTVAVALKTPELVLEDGEADTLSKSVVTVLDQYNIVPDPKITAVVGLVIAASSIYGPRYYNITERRKAERKQRQVAKNNLNLVS